MYRFERYFGSSNLSGGASAGVTQCRVLRRIVGEVGSANLSAGKCPRSFRHWVVGESARAVVADNE